MGRALESASLLLAPAVAVWLAASPALADPAPPSHVVVLADPCLSGVVEADVLMDILRIELASQGVQMSRTRGEGVEVALGCDSRGVVVRVDDADGIAIEIAEIEQSARPRVIALALADAVMAATGARTPASTPQPAPPAAADTANSPVEIEDTVEPGVAVVPVWSATLRIDGVGVVGGDRLAGGSLVATRWGERLLFFGSATVFSNTQGDGAALLGAKLGLRGPSAGRWSSDGRLGLEVGGSRDRDGSQKGLVVGMVAVAGRCAVAERWDVGGELSYRRANLDGGDVLAFGLALTRYFR